MYRGCPWALASAQVVHVAVNHHDAVIHNHAKGDNKCRKGDGVHLVADDVHHGDGDGRSERNLDGGNERRGDGEKQQHDSNDHKNGRQQILEERPDAVVHHLGEVGDAGEGHPVGKKSTEVLQDHVHILAKLNNIVARPHLYAQHQRLIAVVSDVACGGCIVAHNARHILQADGLPEGRRIYHLFAQFSFRLVGTCDMEGDRLITIRKRAAYAQQTLAEELRCDDLIADAVGGQLFLVDIHIQLLMLTAEGLDVAHRRHRAQPPFKEVHVAFHLAVGLVARVKGHQHGRRVAEIVYHHQGQHTSRQLTFEVLQAMTYLRPHLGLIHHAVVQLHVYIHHTLLRVAVGAALAQLLKGEKVVLKRGGDLLLHLIAPRTGVDRSNNALTNDKLGELLLVHPVKTIDAQDHQQCDYQEDNLGIGHNGLYDSSSLLHVFSNGDYCFVCGLTSMPSETFSMPSTITVSFSCSPSLIRTPVRVKSATPTGCL